ncbi:MAG: hypothetical protein ACJ763_03200 [Bdellovibrionia bacterium]
MIFSKRHFFHFLLSTVLATSAIASDFDRVTPHERRELIRRAQIWFPTPVSSMDLFAGPKDRDSFEFGQTVKCTYVKHDRGNGTSPKFYCRTDSGDEIKVRYGEDNNEIYAQVAASRLLWALGFVTNANYPVRIQCYGCSDDPWDDPRFVPQTVTFEDATIERTIRAHEVCEIGKTKQGWGWLELDTVKEELGGATRAQIDALKLLGVFMSHIDSRPNNQKLICPMDEVVTENEHKKCRKPLMYITDVGTTFGGAHETVGFTTLKLRHWKHWSIWADPRRCIADILPEGTNPQKLRYPKISEKGRRFLADLLAQLSDSQIRDLFRAARADRVKQYPGYASVDEWVEAFKFRRAQIVNHRCD